MNFVERQVIADDIVKFYVRTNRADVLAPGPMFYNFIDKSSVPNEVMFRTSEKFPERYLVWQAIDLRLTSEDTSPKHM